MARTEWQRKRNQYVGNCAVCGVECQPGAGWLYSDTRSQRSRSKKRVTGRWTKFVKCDRCHTLGVAHRSQLPENAPPPPDKVTVAEIRAGRLVACVVEERRFGGVFRRPVVMLILADGSKEPVAYLKAITGEQTCAQIDKRDGNILFGGRVLTSAARQEFNLIALWTLNGYEQFFNDFDRVEG